MTSIGKLNKNKINMELLLFVFPSVLIILFVMIYPLIMGFYFSLTNRLFGYEQYSFIGFKHYMAIVRDNTFWVSFFNTMQLTIITLVCVLVLGLGFALLINNNMKITKVFRSFLLIPWVMPSMVTALIFRWLYNDYYGYVNFALTEYGILSSPINLLADSKLAFLGVLLPMIWSRYPFVMLVFLAALQSIDKNLYEAAKIDGANLWQSFLSITLPALKPVTILIIVLEIIRMFGAVDLVYLLTRGGPGNSTLTFGVYIYKMLFDSFDLGYCSALAAVMFVLLFFFTMFYFWIIKRYLNYE